MSPSTPTPQSTASHVRSRATAARFARVVVLLGISCGLTCGSLDADPAKRAPRRSQVVPTTRAAPDITSTIPAAKTPNAPPPANDEALPTPFNLPSASRARMRTCGLEWQSIKLAGNAGDQTWREFATKCLAAKDDAAKGDAVKDGAAKGDAAASR